MSANTSDNENGSDSINRQLSNMSLNHTQPDTLIHNLKRNPNDGRLLFDGIPTLGVRSDQIFLGIFLKKEDGSSVSESEMSKVEDIIWFALWKYEEVRMHTHNEPGIELFYERHLSEKAPVHSEDTNYIYIKINDSYEKMTAFTRQRTISLNIPTALINELAQSQATFTEQNWDAYDKICCHIVHEMAHVYGCLHADTGVMSGVVQVFRKNHTDFKLWEVMDPISLRIIAETFSREKTPDMNVFVVYDEPKHRLTIKSPIEITSVIFLKQLHYITMFETFAPSCEVTAPDYFQWNYVMICLVYGQQVTFTRDSVRKNGSIFKLRNF